MFGSLLSIGASLIGGLGGKSKGEAASAPQSGFATLPEPVQKAWLDTYLPDVLKNYDQPRTPIPLMRAEQPASPFDSAELHNLQKFSDAVGGYFSPLGQPAQQVYNPGGPAPANAAPTGDADLEQTARNAILLHAAKVPTVDANRLLNGGPEFLRAVGKTLKDGTQTEMQGVLNYLADRGIGPGR